MQGRLSPQINGIIQSFPINSWKYEFEQASQLGFETMEWVFDLNDNPIMHNQNIDEILFLSEKYDVQINSVCADYFMEKRLFSESENVISQNIKMLEKLITQSEKLGISLIEIPLVDISSLKTEQNKLDFKKNIEKILPLLDTTDISILLETDLSPLDFKNYLLQFDTSKIFANYDSGNSASLGYVPDEELTILKKWIKNVHVKDRKLGGETVPFGTGNTNFDSFFSSLHEINYSDDLILQGSRCLENTLSPSETCQKYLDFVNEYLNKYYN